MSLVTNQADDIRQIYQQYKLPSWAPPPKLFGIVWPILYVLMFFSFSSVFVKYFQGAVDKAFIAPFIINVIANALFVTLQVKGFQQQGAFKWIASIDILVIWATLWVILNKTINGMNGLQWVGWMNVPYFLWVSFAFVLQVYISLTN